MRVRGLAIIIVALLTAASPGLAHDETEGGPLVGKVNFANSCAPEVQDDLQRERYAEEWTAHLAEVPGVVGKLAVSLQFQIAVFGARELDAHTRLAAAQTRTRLAAWRNELEHEQTRAMVVVRDGDRASCLRSEAWG